VSGPWDAQGIGLSAYSFDAGANADNNFQMSLIMEVLERNTCELIEPREN